MHPYLSVGAEADGDIGNARSRCPPARGSTSTAGCPPAAAPRSTGASAGSASAPSTTPSPTWSATPTAWARVRVSGPAGSLELAVDGSWTWLQAYTGDTLPPGQRRRSVAVEPMTCPPNALADGADLVVLEPGEEWAGSWTLSWTPAG